MYVLIFFIKLRYLCIYLKKISELACLQNKLRHGFPAHSRYLQSLQWWEPSVVAGRSNTSLALRARSPAAAKACLLRHTQARELGTGGEGSSAPGMCPPPLQLPASLGLQRNRFLFPFFHLAMPSLQHQDISLLCILLQRALDTEKQQVLY